MINGISDMRPNSQYMAPVKKGEARSSQDSSVDVSVETSIEPAVASLTTQADNNPLTKDNASQQELPAEKAKKITETLNNLLETTSTKLRYQYHEKLDKYYVTLVDSETEEVVREIPDRKLMDIYAAMLDFIGVFVDKKI